MKVEGSARCLRFSKNFRSSAKMGCNLPLMFTVSGLGTLMVYYNTFGISKTRDIRGSGMVEYQGGDYTGLLLRSFKHMTMSILPRV